MGWGIGWSILSVLALLIGPALGISMLKQRKRILRTPLRDTNKLTDGLVSVQGRAKQFVPLVGPFSGEDLVYYEAKAKQMEITEKDKARQNTFDTIYEDKSVYPFFIEDPHGRILVSPNDAHTNIIPNFRHDTYKRGVGNIKSTMPPPLIAATLDEAGVSYTSNAGPLPLEIEESNIAVDENIFAIGLCSSKQEDIDKALGTIQLEPTDDVPRVLISGDEKKDENLYIALGDQFAATHELTTYGTTSIIVGILIGLAAAGAATYQFMSM